MALFKDFADVIEVAIRIEREGIELYKKLYEMISSVEAKPVFSYLAAEEEKHAGVFRTMLETVADYTPRYDYPGEYGAFLNGVAADLTEKIKKNLKKMPATNASQAIDVGIELEKETILFYLELKSDGKLTPEQEKILEKVINEERSHWRKLLELREKIKF